MTGSPLLTLYARREPDLNYHWRGYERTALYRTGDSVPVAVYPFHYESRPTRSQKSVMHNCHRYRLEWLPDLIGPSVDVGYMKRRAMGYGPGRAPGIANHV